MSVGIGPLIFKEQNLGTDNLDKLQNQLNKFIEENQNAFKVANQLQLIFYFLNTLQPISVFLLLNASYPPQLYKFYQLTGTFIFPRVSDYQDNNLKMEFSVFGYNIDSDLCDISDYGKFRQLGFCQSILINIPILLIKQAVMILLIAIINNLLTVTE
ncbi:bowman-birk serine protease inhibitor family protein, putative (macronuclear) [Tetrahymena thermophila SB210]|uniref:Bowman-birk serine protease inhibitor family protein, putative n=1 Tax=Tetrahymena thermophila (strain SB210) TaxID=312017 RepID=W7X9B0_TETTS|nr:bowman-birk serine protease inhibitor family protein, putative [Tetrahymena thermophila SB210]EWS72973.1 bowman-birk serine protease inhibitor family protein, putative [Tetrahymena thermophila SB210]|eukprot:XP_012654506.1 bowman-birk serine protease inhibitor family protein, putative [Tetrahymena thermophila SB210]